MTSFAELLEPLGLVDKYLEAFQRAGVHFEVHYLWLRSRAYMFADEFGHLRWHVHLPSCIRVVNLKDRFGENVRRLTCVGTARAMGQPVRRNVDLVSSSHRQYAWLGVRRLVGTISQHLRTSAPTWTTTAYSGTRLPPAAESGPCHEKRPGEDGRH